MQPINRIEPALPAHAMKTFTIAAPLATHWRAATCAEVKCPAHLNGWVTLVDEASELGQMQAHYIRRVSGRAFTEAKDPTGQMTSFRFEAGQSCFRSGDHRIQLEREPIHIVRGGDWRGNPSGERRVFDRGDQWVDSFAEHQDKLATRLAQG